MTEEHDDRRSKHNMMTGGARNMSDSGIEDSDSDESRRKLKMKEDLTCGCPLPLLPKGERKMERKNGESISQCMSVVINDKGGDCWINCH